MGSSYGYCAERISRIKMIPAPTKPISGPTIGVLILNRNGRDWLPTIYDSIRRDVYPHVRVYLVDNGSNDGSIEITLENYPEVTIIRLPQNLGYCMAYNVAMPYAFADGCEWVIWANNDIKVEPGCLEELARAALSDQRIGVVGPAFHEWDGEGPNYYMVGNHPAACLAMAVRSPEAIDVEWVEGSFLMVSRQCVQDVGALDPYLFFYWEETDFCRRARYKGWRVVLAPDAIARHYAGGWSKGNQKNILTANRLQSKNYYIYELANPFQGFTRNLINALHLFAVNIKMSMLTHPSAVFAQLAVFWMVLKEIGTIYKKWCRDVTGEPPPLTTTEFQSARPVILGEPSE
jgi:GT2 family glycosyltransferase